MESPTTMDFLEVEMTWRVAHALLVPVSPGRADMAAAAEVNVAAIRVL